MTKVVSYLTLHCIFNVCRLYFKNICVFPYWNEKIRHFILCYTLIMKEPAYWDNWAQFLQHWGLKNLTVKTFEASSALPVLFSQFLYFLQPLVSTNETSFRIGVMAEMLENHDERALFIEYIKRKDE